MVTALVRDRPVLTHAAWAIVWLVPGMWNAYRLDAAAGVPDTMPWPVGAAVMIVLIVGMHAVGVWIDRGRRGSGSRLRAFAWIVPPLTLFLPVLLPLFD